MDYAAWRRVAGKAAGLVLGRWVAPFVQSLVSAVIIIIAYWFASLVYYRIDINYAARLYLGGFVSDLFGHCARSGFGDAWGYECIA